MTTEGVDRDRCRVMANSIALIGYGVDSTITGVASVIIIWRFTGDRLNSDDAEVRAQKIVAITFFLLAPYIIIAAIHHLVTGSEAQASWVGIGLAIVSITLMPLFGRAKKRIGNRLDRTPRRARESRTSDELRAGGLQEGTVRLVMWCSGGASARSWRRTPRSRPSRVLLSRGTMSRRGGGTTLTST